MTLATTSNTVVCQGNGATTSFDFTFPVPLMSELVVYYTNSAGVTILLQQTQYSVTGIGSANGGSVNYPLSGSPIPAGAQLTIQRIVPYVQLTSLVNQAGFYPNVVENALDYLTMQTQQLAEEQQLTLSVPLAATPSNLLLPGAVGRANTVIGFDQNGNVEVLPISPSVGAGTLTDVSFLANAGFTPGVTTQLPLPAAYGSATNVWPFFDGLLQFGCTLVGNVITFPSPIPVGTQEVLIRCGTTLSTTQPSDFYNAGNYGAKGNGTTDDTAAVQAAINAAHAAGGGTVLLPSSAYLLGPLTLYPNVCVAGAGKYSTTLLPNAPSITMFALDNASVAYAGVVLRDFQINCGAAASVIGMQFTLCSEVDILNVSFAGCQTNFVIDRGYMHNVLNCESTQTSTNKAGTATVWSSVDTDHVFNTTVWNYKIHSNVYYGSGGGLGCQGPGIYFRRAIEAMLNMSANDLVTGGAVNGVVWENDCEGCSMVNCQFGAVSIGVLVQTGSGAAASPSTLTIENCAIAQPAQACVDITSGSNITIRGGFFTAGATNTVAAIVAVNFGKLLIDGVQVSGFSGANGTAVYLSGMADVRVTNMRSDNNLIGIDFANTNTNVAIENNDFVNTGSPIAGVGAGGAGNVVRNNRGTNTSFSQPSVPSSGVSTTNVSGYPCRVYVAGGTVTGTAINGAGTGITSGFICVLNPGESIVITYTVAPTWVWIPM